MPYRARRAAACAVAVLAASTCTHGEPFAPAPVDTRPPFATGFPRRLTFNPGMDVTPSVTADTLVYSRGEPQRADRDACLAVLPVDGGVMAGQSCPHAGGADARQDVWLEPAISPDRTQLAFVRQSGQLGATLPDTRALVVAARDRPDSARVLVPGNYDTGRGQTGNAFRHVSWVDDGTLRFLGGLELYDAMSRDTVFVAYGVFRVDLGSGGPSTPVWEADALAYDTGGDGALYVVPPSDPSAVYAIPAGGTLSLLARFGTTDASTLTGLTALAMAEGVPVVIGTFQLPPPGGTSVEILMQDVAAGLQQKSLWSTGRPRRLAHVPGRRLVVAEIAGSGAPDLWLLETR